MVECTRALSPSGLPGLDYALNPYTGCEHGCIYCYAPGVTHTDLGSWRVVRVKRNIPERLARELPSVEGVIGLGTVTDPYQYAERKFRLTQMCLEVLRARGRRVHIHTKSLIAPVMSSLEGRERELLEAICDTGVRSVFHDPLNLRNVDPTRLERMGIGQSSVARRRIGEIGRELGLDVSDSFENRLPDILPSM